MTRTPELQPDAASAGERLKAAYEQAASDPEESAAFYDAVRRISWKTVPAAQLKQAIDMAVSVGAVQLASELAMLGSETYPDSDSLARYARILAPSKVTRLEGPAAPGAAASMAWIREHAGRYRGLWVAVEEGRLLGTAASRKELVRQLGDAVKPHTLLTYIP